MVNKKPGIRFTSSGREKACQFIEQLKAKRKEILDAGKDTVCFKLPDLDYILEDIEGDDDAELTGKYIGVWGATDHYEGDCPLELDRDVDYVPINKE